MTDTITRCGACGRKFGERAKWVVANWVHFGAVPCLAAITHVGCAHKLPLCQRPRTNNRGAQPLSPPGFPKESSDCPATVAALVVGPCPSPPNKA